MIEIHSRYNLLRRRIKSRKEAHQFLQEMEDLGLLFHPEDAPDTVVDRSGYFLFTEVESELLLQRMGEVYDYEPNPCAFCMALRKPDPEPEPDPEPSPLQQTQAKLDLATQQLEILCTNLDQGMSKSIQRLMARSTREVLAELTNPNLRPT